MNTIGKTIKKIRLLKNLSSKVIYENLIDRSHYWRIETDKSLPSIDLFFKLLKRLNITPSEFLLYYEEESEYTYIKCGKKFIEYSQLDNLEELVNLKLFVEEQLYISNEIRFYHLSLLIEIYIAKMQKKKINDMKEVNILKEYLFNCEEWTYYEISLLNNTLFSYDYDICLLLYNKVLNKILKNEIKLYNNEEVLISINIISICLLNKDKKKALEIYKNLSEGIIEERSTYSRIMILWIEGILSIYKGLSIEGDHLIQKAFNILLDLDMNSSYKLLNDWTSKLLSDKDMF